MRQRRDDSFNLLSFVFGQANVRRVPKGWRYALLPQRDHGVKKTSREPGKIERQRFPELYYSIASLLFAPSDRLRDRVPGRDGLGRINPQAAQKFSGRAVRVCKECGEQIVGFDLLAALRARVLQRPV